MDDQIQTEASRWFTRLLAPDCAPAERIEFERWRGSSPERATAYARVERLMGRVPELRNDAAISHAIQSAMVVPSTRHRAPIIAIAACIMLAVLGFAFFHFGSQGEPDVRYATAVGEQRSIKLEDGTTIRLDTDTQLAVHYTSAERKVFLRQGRAQYTVSHDVMRPFIVDTLGGTVTAIGTQFQTSIQEGIATVTLLQGKVVVSNSAGAVSHQALLAPGEQVTYDAQGAIWNKANADVEAASDWTQGKLVFKDKALRELVREVNRYSSAKLRIADPSVAALRISGTFKADDQESLLLALQGIWSIQASPQPNGDILLSRSR